MSKSGSNTKKDLMDNGISIIKQKGYKNTTIDDICEASGITKGTFYYHFKSKIELVTYFYVSSMNQIIKSNMGNLDSMLNAKNSWEQILLVFKPMNEMCTLAGPEVLLEVIKENADNKITVFSLEEDGQNDLITSLIAKGQKEGVIRNQSTAICLSRAIKYAAKGVAWQWCLNEGSFDKSKELELIFAGILDVLPELR